jgi:hypothetical protein
MEESCLMFIALFIENKKRVSLIIKTANQRPRNLIEKLERVQSKSTILTITPFTSFSSAPFLLLYTQQCAQVNFIAVREKVLPLASALLAFFLFFKPILNLYNQ